MTTIEIKTFDLSVEKLSVYANNARRHPESQIQSLMSAIQEFGFTQPIVVNDQYTILAGHARFEAAKRIGLNQLPCRVVSGLTEAKQKAYIIADNKITEESSWDYDILLHEINSIHELDFNDDLNRLFNFSDHPSYDLNKEADYKPITNPTQGTGLNVTDAMVEQKQQKLTNQFAGKSDKQLVEITCPHCDESFTVNQNTLS